MKACFKAALLAAAFVTVPALAQQTARETIPVTLGGGINGVQSGRLIVFAKQVDPIGQGAGRGRYLPLRADRHGDRRARHLVAEARRQSPRSTAIPTASRAHSASFRAGTYAFQAVLDRNHDYNYGGRGAGDLVSPVVEAKLPGPIPMLTLSTIDQSDWLKGRLARICPMPSARRSRRR